MTDLMEREMQAVFYMVLAGLAVMMLFYVRDKILQYFLRYKRAYRVVYLLFWVFASYLFYQFLYKASYGTLNWYSFIAFAGGCMLWKRAFYDIITLNETVHNYDGDRKNEKENKRSRKGI